MPHFLIDLHRVRAARHRLARLARENPELTKGDGNLWANSLDDLEVLLDESSNMPETPPKQRQKAFRDRKRAAGYQSVTVWLPGEIYQALVDRADQQEGPRSEGMARVISEAMAALIDRDKTSNKSPRKFVSRNGNGSNMPKRETVTGNDKAVPCNVTRNSPPAPTEVPGGAVSGGGAATLLAPNQYPGTDTMRAEGLRLMEQGLKLSKIADQWNKAGIPTAKGCQWSRQGVHQLLKSAPAPSLPEGVDLKRVKDSTHERHGEAAVTLDGRIIGRVWRDPNARNHWTAEGENGHQVEDTTKAGAVCRLLRED